MKFASLSFAVLGLLLSGCGGPGKSVEITEVTERSELRPAPRPNVRNSERFRYAAGISGFQMDSSSAEAGSNEVGSNEVGLHFELPEGWMEIAPTEFRTVNLRFGSEAEGECYVSVLPGGGGGVPANVNRWRGQMGLAAYTTDEFAALPRYEIMGEEAVYLEFDGAYTGMGNAGTMEGARLRGLLLELEGSGVYIKMVGPKELVEAESRHFEEFSGSLHSGSGHSHGDAAALAPASPAGAGLPDGHPPMDDAHAAAASDGASIEPASDEPVDASGGGFRWTAPAGWQRTGERTMRLVTYVVDEAKTTECYVSLLGGAAGGMMPNVNRWLDQFGGAAKTEEELAELPQIEVLGREVALIEAAGSFTSMRGEEKSGQALWGVAWISEQGSVFIKMTGPETEVMAQKSAFVAFCSSLERE